MRSLFPYKRPPDCWNVISILNPNNVCMFQYGNFLWYLTLHMYICFKPSHSNGATTKYRFNQHHFLHNTTNNKQQAAHLKNTDTVIPPCRHQLPAVLILMVSAIALCPMVVCDPRNKAMKFLYIKLTHIFFHLHFSCFWPACLRQKICFCIK